MLRKREKWGTQMGVKVVVVVSMAVLEGDDADDGHEETDGVRGWQTDKARDFRSSDHGGRGAWFIIESPTGMHRVALNRSLATYRECM